MKNIIITPASFWARPSIKSNIVKARQTSAIHSFAYPNITSKTAVVRALFIGILPWGLWFDWYLGTKLIYLISPIVYYLEISAMTLFCPIKFFYEKYK